VGGVVGGGGWCGVGVGGVVSFSVFRTRVPTPLVRAGGGGKVISGVSLTMQKLTWTGRGRNLRLRLIDTNLEIESRIFGRTGKRLSVSRGDRGEASEGLL